MRRPPDLTGKGHDRRFRVESREQGALPESEASGPWSAWKATIAAGVKQIGTELDTWYVHAPGAHPLWDWHVVFGVALREVAGLPPAVISIPGATHEIFIFALNPAVEPVVDISNDAEGPRMLMPANAVRQVVGLTDETANELMFLMARAMVAGHMNPDDDFRAANVEIIDATADHLRRGMHVPS